MSLKNQIPEILRYIADHNAFIEHNKCVIDIYEGNLAPYVLDVLKSTLSKNYYDQIKGRVLPINILKRVNDKLSKVYATDVIREDAKNQKFIDDYSKLLKINQSMSVADEYSNLFKGYLLEPYLYNGVPQLRVIPYDRFLVMSDDKTDPTRMTMVIKFMGERKKKDIFGRTSIRNKYYVYTKDEFLAIDSDGEVIGEDMVENNGINPLGRIPFVYGNRSRLCLVPKQDTDILAITKMIPVLLTDLSGALMFSVFSIIYGIDIDQANLVMSPNAYWDLKSDPKSDKTPSIGTIKPDADIDKALNYIYQVFSLWLESKGVRIGSIGTLNSGNLQSGVSKIIDEMDTFEVRKINIKFFENEEQELWSLLKDMNNYWVKSGQFKYKLVDNLDLRIEFDDPKPIQSDKEILDILLLQLDKGLISKEEVLKQFYPNWKEDKIYKMLYEVKNQDTISVDQNDTSYAIMEDPNGSQATDTSSTQS